MQSVSLLLPPPCAISILTVRKGSQSTTDTNQTLEKHIVRGLLGFTAGFSSVSPALGHRLRISCLLRHLLRPRSASPGGRDGALHFAGLPTLIGSFICPFRILSCIFLLLLPLFLLQINVWPLVSNTTKSRDHEKNQQIQGAEGPQYPAGLWKTGCSLKFPPSSKTFNCFVEISLTSAGWGQEELRLTGTMPRIIRRVGLNLESLIHSLTPQQHHLYLLFW